MPTCSRCGKDVGTLGGLFYNTKANRCSTCDKDVKKLLGEFRKAFIQFCDDGLLSVEEWHRLYEGAEKRRLVWSECLEYIRGDALNFLERYLTFASVDGIITPDEEKYFMELSQALRLPDPLLNPLIERLEYLKQITKIRQGYLTAVKAGIHLESNELCYLEQDATYLKVRTSSILPIEGRFVATNQKLIFLSQAGGWNIAWKNVMRIDVDSRSIYLELSTKSGNGRYLTSDPVKAEATLTTLTRLAKRQLLTPTPDAESRHITQDVKVAVWQRDQGKCVQCGANSYLEFDHIIPFSKGGANTLNNVQLLCRRCNQAKSDKI